MSAPVWSDLTMQHIAISAPDPERAARVIADLWRGEAMAMPPQPDTWVAYADDEQDSAVEVYPLRNAPPPGARKKKAGAAKPKAAHIVLASPLSQAKIESIARRENAIPRVAERGPFTCVDLWIEDWLHIEVVTFTMRVDHARAPNVAARRADPPAARLAG